MPRSRYGFPTTTSSAPFFLTVFSFIFLMISEMFYSILLNTIIPTMKWYRHHETRWLPVIIVRAVSSGLVVNTWTNYNISSSSHSAPALSQIIIGLSSTLKTTTRSSTKKSFTSERQKNVRNGWDESLGVTSVNEYFHLICINIQQQQKLSHIRSVTVNLKQNVILFNYTLIVYL